MVSLNYSSIFFRRGGWEGWKVTCSSTPKAPGWGCFSSISYTSSISSISSPPPFSSILCWVGGSSLLSYGWKLKATGEGATMTGSVSLFLLEVEFLSINSLHSINNSGDVNRFYSSSHILIGKDILLWDELSAYLPYFSPNGSFSLLGTRWIGFLDWVKVSMPSKDWAGLNVISSSFSLKVSSFKSFRIWLSFSHSFLGSPIDF